jgi:hypothetical protein
MSVDMTTERLVERGSAILAWQAAGGDVGKLARLDRAVRKADPRTTDWPGRRPGPEVRNGIPDLDWADWEARNRGRP